MMGISAVLSTFTLYVLTHCAVCRWGDWRPHGRAINILWLCFLPVFGVLFFVFGGTLNAPLGVVDLLNGLLLDVLLLLALIALTAIAAYHLSILIELTPKALPTRRRA